MAILDLQSSILGLLVKAAGSDEESD